MTSILTPLQAVKVVNHVIRAHGNIPNSEASGRPLTIYRNAFTSTASPSAIENHLNKTDVVAPKWRYTMYSTSHFHSTSHEVLVVFKGEAELCFGHEQNPNRVVEKVRRGDVIIVPAGVAHRLLHDSDGSFTMIGSYPKGKDWDMCYGREDEGDHHDRIKNLEWFKKNPIYGDGDVPAAS